MKLYVIVIDKDIDNDNDEDIVRGSFSNYKDAELYVRKNPHIPLKIIAEEVSLKRRKIKVF